jgi:hypothetical protein
MTPAGYKDEFASWTMESLGSGGIPARCLDESFGNETTR